MDISKLTNEELLRRTEELASDLRVKTCDLIESLVEFDRRKLYRNLEYTSLFEYCIYKLKMSDAAAYRRIRAARAFQAYPPVKDHLRSGALTLESLILLHPFLNDADAGALVANAAGKRVWEVEQLVAGRRTEAPRRDVVRFTGTIPAPPAQVESRPESSLFDSLGAASPTEIAPKTSMAEAKPVAAALEPRREPAALVPPPAPGVRIAFTADAEFFKLLKEAQAAMRHKYPNGRLDGVFRDALKALLKKKRPWAS